MPAARLPSSRQTCRWRARPGGWGRRGRWPRRGGEAASSAYGRVDVLYNNAGVMPEADHSVLDTDVDTWDKVMAVNLRGVFLGCKHAIPRMLEQGSGSVINISSFVALLGCSVPQDAYTPSNGGGRSLPRALPAPPGP